MYRWLHVQLLVAVVRQTETYLVTRDLDEMHSLAYVDEEIAYESHIYDRTLLLKREMAQLEMMQ